jgi:hypothetical protein
MQHGTTIWLVEEIRYCTNTPHIINYLCNHWRVVSQSLAKFKKKKLTIPLDIQVGHFISFFYVELFYSKMPKNLYTDALQ